MIWNSITKIGFSSSSESRRANLFLFPTANKSFSPCFWRLQTPKSKLLLLLYCFPYRGSLKCDLLLWRFLMVAMKYVHTAHRINKQRLTDDVRDWLPQWLWNWCMLEKGIAVKPILQSIFPNLLFQDKNDTDPRNSV